MIAANLVFRKCIILSKGKILNLSQLNHLITRRGSMKYQSVVSLFKQATKLFDLTPQKYNIFKIEQN